MIKIFMMIGAPGIGKSTWAKNHADKLSNNYKIISRDEIRFKMLIGNGDANKIKLTTTEYFSKEDEVVKEFISQIKSCVKNNKDVFIDSTNLSIFSRNKLKKELNFSDEEVEYIAIFFVSPISVCLERNNKREGLKKVPYNSICNMCKKIQYPSEREHFKNVVIIAP